MGNIPTIALKIQGGELSGKVVVTKVTQIHYLKKLIELGFGVKTQRQILSFNDKELDSTGTIESYNSIDGATLSLSMTPRDGNPKFPIRLIFRHSNTLAEFVNVKETYLVEDLNNKIGKRWAFPATKIDLTYRGRELEDGFTLSAYLIDEHSAVDVHMKTEAR